MVCHVDRETYRNIPRHIETYPSLYPISTVYVQNSSINLADYTRIMPKLIMLELCYTIAGRMYLSYSLCRRLSYSRCRC